MKIARQIVVLDAHDLTAESTFWAGLLGGTVDEEDCWHTFSVSISGHFQIGSTVDGGPDRARSAPRGTLDDLGRVAGGRRRSGSTENVPRSIDTLSGPTCALVRIGAQLSIEASPARRSQ